MRQNTEIYGKWDRRVIERYEYLKAIKDVIYLAYCGVNERKPSSARVQKMDISAVYEAANIHLLTAICAMSLGSAGINDERFTQAEGKGYSQKCSDGYRQSAAI